MGTIAAVGGGPALRKRRGRELYAHAVRTLRQCRLAAHPRRSARGLPAGVRGLGRELLGDLSRNYRALSVEMRRRLSNRWSMRVELIANVDVDPEDITYDARRDSFLPFDFNYNF